jgi:hypothetical protein
MDIFKMSKNEKWRWRICKNVILLGDALKVVFRNSVLLHNFLHIFTLENYFATFH